MPKRYIPNILTSMRILLTPIFLLLLFSGYQHGKLFALIVFIIASLTDLYDGILARKFNTVSKFGMFLDPLADKFLVLSAFISFCIIGDVELWMLIVIIVRDIFVTLLRSIMEAKKVTMHTSKGGKLKTTLQMIVIHLILLIYVFQSYKVTPIEWFFDAYPIVYILMLVTTIVTAYTGIDYFRQNYQTLKNLKND
ncbi:MAG: CDP-diacylglycerol--glycerol-3-phosphate 3-phosphatidyltransferase [Candidatus Marinimicrobia bacterium]|nr:CDP-diacylglycerol--glycerol-3-phosphate 3-phosphatidyltransferase [Candidatus Neomarinimicrobiota bacterium]MBL7023626.1 CDP-diacylglycerol--glycerol-3-phosphate 3-phosphatidyltransferase [Candidatus Neomarinimicrobiota bacterium]MBL7109813.1 CDP-diacylglycerol--glycerol-3-phosphate 3-phosphatidyltransferase [Candidatus Neomarinimicrobiota bacterium]